VTSADARPRVCIDAAVTEEIALRLQYVGCGLYLLACLLIGNVVGQYAALRPLAEVRGLGPGTVLGAAIGRFDLAYASVGLLAGIASLAVLGWVTRGK
jgi:hypothetical protein